MILIISLFWGSYNSLVKREENVKNTRGETRRHRGTLHATPHRRGKWQ